MIQIRPEETRDQAAVYAVNASAFETADEANLVDALRRQAEPLISLVAVEGEAVMGHILFSPVTHAENPDLRIMGLAPMAVAPAHQRRGIGSDLVRAGLDECRQLGCEAVVVLGHPEFYPRFGFVPSTRFGIRSEYDVPENVFLVMELVAGALRNAPGTVRYHPAFAGV